jgi:hypothetical protein
MVVVAGSFPLRCPVDGDIVDLVHEQTTPVFAGVGGQGAIGGLAAGMLGEQHGAAAFPPEGVGANEAPQAVVIDPDRGALAQGGPQRCPSSWPGGARTVMASSGRRRPGRAGHRGGAGPRLISVSPAGPGAGPGCLGRAVRSLGCRRARSAVPARSGGSRRAQPPGPSPGPQPGRAHNKRRDADLLVGPVGHR